MPRLVIKPDKCTGCNSCMLACSFAHEGYFSFSKSRIQIKKNEEIAVSNPKVCTQCPNPICTEVCPVAALSQNTTTGLIRWNGGRCIHCHLCEAACPYGGIIFERQTDDLLVCDLCGGDPACVKACELPGAIRYE
jgi:anaerobic carbon-monoxide dehydrogenase iron sulfur subunit